MKIYTNKKSKCNCKKCLRNLKVIKIKIKTKNKYLSKIVVLIFPMFFSIPHSCEKFDFFFVKIINQNKSK